MFLLSYTGPTLGQLKALNLLRFESYNLAYLLHVVHMSGDVIKQRDKKNHCWHTISIFFFITLSVFCKYFMETILDFTYNYVSRIDV